jgi:hypothetical protein
VCLCKVVSHSQEISDCCMVVKQNFHVHNVVSCLTLLRIKNNG